MEHHRPDSLSLVATLAPSALAILFFEWHTDEPLVVLPVQLFVCASAGSLLPQHRLLLGAVLGWAVLAAHALSAATGLMSPRYQSQPPTLGDWFTMSLLVLPGLAASFAGSILRKTISAARR